MGSWSPHSSRPEPGPSSAKPGPPLGKGRWRSVPVSWERCPETRPEARLLVTRRGLVGSPAPAIFETQLRTVFGNLERPAFVRMLPRRRFGHDGVEDAEEVIAALDDPPAGALDVGDRVAVEGGAHEPAADRAELSQEEVDAAVSAEAVLQRVEVAAGPHHAPQLAQAGDRVV